MEALLIFCAAIIPEKVEREECALPISGTCNTAVGVDNMDTDTAED